jgi:predicted ATPase
MKIQSLHIKNFKSIVDLTLTEPNPFTVFVGPNGAGKSNIFEALEFMNYVARFGGPSTVEMFGGESNFTNAQYFPQSVLVEYIIENYKYYLSKQSYQDEITGKELATPYIVTGYDIKNPPKKGDVVDVYSFYKQPYFPQFSGLFKRIFIKKDELNRIKLENPYNINPDASNLEKILKRILLDDNKREEVLEWVQLLIPEFENIEIDVDVFDGQAKLKIKEKYSDKIFGKSLISDGTYNILALLTAVYQSEEPQFLCIEEPENGLNPYVVRKLVDFFRAACQEKGHYIWLNTHSHDLVACLEPDEVVVVDKIGGETQVKQIKGMNLHGLDMAEVWLSGALGGGTPW